MLFGCLIPYSFGLVERFTTLFALETLLSLTLRQTWFPMPVIDGTLTRLNWLAEFGVSMVTVGGSTIVTAAVLLTGDMEWFRFVILALVAIIAVNTERLFDMASVLGVNSLAFESRSETCFSETAKVRGTEFLSLTGEIDLGSSDF